MVKAFTIYAFLICALLGWANIAGRTLGFFSTSTGQQWGAKGPGATSTFNHK
ncbi:MAG: hypothetical protein ABL958_14415 [Bdellovibrionia bacterium]